MYDIYYMEYFQSSHHFSTFCINIHFPKMSVSKSKSSFWTRIFLLSSFHRCSTLWTEPFTFGWISYTNATIVEPFYWTLQVEKKRKNGLSEMNTKFEVVNTWFVDHILKQYYTGCPRNNRSWKKDAVSSHKICFEKDCIFWII